MKKLMLLTACSLLFVLTACGGTRSNGEEKQWSKPQRVLEGCDGVMSNSRQCQKNPNTQQSMIQIDRK